MNEQEHDDFIEECCKYIPESYDGDEAAEAIILRYLKDLQDFASVLVKVIDPWR